MIDALKQILCDNKPECRRKRAPNLRLFLMREHLDDPVDRLGRVLGMQRPKHQMSRSGSFYG
jgi:hypothetical protein